MKRILHEEELAKLQEQEDRAASQAPSSEGAEASKRMSERQARTQKEQHKKELEKLAEEEGKWYFDCAKCGMHGENLDDGSHSVACDKCGVWQHSKCHGFSPKQAEKAGFTFVCSTCKRKEEDAKKPKIPPLKLSKGRSSASPEISKAASRPATANGPSRGSLPPHVARQLDGVDTAPQRPSPGPFGQIITNGPSLSPYGQTEGPPGYRYPPVANFAPPPPPQQSWNGTALPPPLRQSPSGFASSPPPPAATSYGHQQHHQYAHQNAVASAGGHPVHHPYPAPPNFQSPYQPNGMHSTTQPNHLQYHVPSSYTPHNYAEYQHMRPPPQNAGSTGNHNGHPPPANFSYQTPSSQAPHQLQLHRPPQPNYQPYVTQHASHSPGASSSPPLNAHQQLNGRSPMKSSPPPPLPPPPVGTAHDHQIRLPPHRFEQTPHNFQSSTANGSYSLHTPQARPGHAAGSNLAADGMSGPWPEGSKAIPQKRDQSPAPPSSSQTVGDTKVLPPVASLAPSPAHAVGHNSTIIPVKKAPEVNGAPMTKLEQHQ